MFINNLPYIGLFFIAIGLVIACTGIIGLAQIRSQDEIRETIGTAIKEGNSFNNVLEGNNPRSSVDTVLDVLEDDKAQVLYLHKNGFDVTEIAKKLNRGKGEIQLIISLNQRGKNQ
ncbi:MAG: hypothetical protein ATN35_08495 [Epulopiscium sp. Nele67-Bin004]|nr:MAG: hypothetical protein ATN35_08495 [Epulopiscium sp. Nele67-Bin004]